MSAILEMCPKDVKEQVMMRLDEIGENYENLRAKVCHTRPRRPSIARRTERYAGGYEGGSRVWQRTRRGGLGDRRRKGKG